MHAQSRGSECLWMTLRWQQQRWVRTRSKQKLQQLSIALGVKKSLEAINIIYESVLPCPSFSFHHAITQCSGRPTLSLIQLATYLPVNSMIWNERLIFMNFGKKNRKLMLKVCILQMKMIEVFLIGCKLLFFMAWKLKKKIADAHNFFTH